ncbi:hypothetical protein [Polyangium sp. 6x1]|uniref:hypothetical protein n=1 Tax=Polyangium sp. 6x1 TaxID=3042689 RepID=UPI0024828A10|nr:hypothetical protein [Polyangium sp. 6x1]MDI1445914.1 hypothetical protein [Polyangium sp. 6x1]
MSLGHRNHGRIVLIGAFVAALFAACAQGNHVEQPGGGGGAGGEGGGGIPPGQIGGPCGDDVPCEQGDCTVVGANKFCTVPCPPGCPDGTYCAIINGDSICVPDLGSQCLPCTTKLQCLNPSDTCLRAPAGDRFCARDCTTDGQCPNGFTCLEGAKYPPKPDGEMPDAGPPDDAGDAGDAGSDDGGTDAGPTKPPQGEAYKFCVPNVPFSCPCSEKRDGVEKDCSNSNDYGTCTGVEMCNGDTAKFEGCTAKVPAAETCNALDDDCDGMINEGDPNELCSAEGPVPPHASWVCTAQGSCDLGPCEPGWASYPPGPISNGCACPVEMGEPNDLCANATAAGSVSDTAGSSLTITGTLGGANDVDVWSFDTVDTNEVTTNSYHVSIDFVAPTPNDEFVIDVIRGDACTDTPTGGGAGITSYDWCVDGKSADGLSGEVPCANDGSQPVHCNNNSTKYFVRVYRKLGAQGSCTQYSLLVTAKGGDPCDFTQKCQ